MPLNLKDDLGVYRSDKPGLKDDLGVFSKSPIPTSLKLKDDLGILGGAVDFAKKLVEPLVNPMKIIETQKQVASQILEYSPKVKDKIERYGKGIASGASATVSGLGSGIEMAGKAIEKLPDITKQIPEEIAKTFIPGAKQIPEKAFSENIKAMNIGQKVKEWGDTAQQYYAVPDPKFDDMVAQGVGSMGMFFLPGMGIAKGVQAASVAPRIATWLGVSASSALEALVESGSTYQRGLEKGMSEKDAMAAGSTSFLVNLPVLLFTNKKGIFGEHGGTMLKALKSSGNEAIQEGIQQLIGNIAVNIPELKESILGGDFKEARDIAGEGVWESVGVGGIVGGGMSAAVSGLEDVGKPALPEDIKPRIAVKELGKVPVIPEIKPEIAVKEIIPTEKPAKAEEISILKPTPKEEVSAPLIEEAKKFKSAEEFVEKDEIIIALNQYEDTGEIETIQDLAEEISAIDTLPSNIKDSIEKYQSAVEEDFKEYGMRGDSDQYETNLLDSLNKYKQQLTEIYQQAHKPEVKKEIKEIKPEEPKRYRATVEEIETLRKKYKLEDVPVDETKKWTTVFKDAEKKKSEVTFITKSIIDKPRVLENAEFAALAIRRAELEDIIDNAEIATEKAIDAGNKAEQARNTTIFTGALDELEELTTALRWSNREAGRALNIVKLTLEKESQQYKLAKIMQKAKMAKGERLTTEETARFKELSKKIKIGQEKEIELQKQVDDLQEKLSKADAKGAFVKTTRTITRKRNIEKLKVERDTLYDQLGKIGYRMNDVVGLTYESAKMISKLATNYFESGVKDIEKIAEEITNKLPDLNKKDIYDSLGGRIKRTKQIVVSDTKKGIRDLKTQARLMGEIEDAYNGIFNISKKRHPPSFKVAKLKQKLKTLKTKSEQSIKDEEILRKILIKIDTLNDLLVTGIKPAKKPRRFEAEATKEAKQTLSEIRRLFDAKNKITDLENQLKTGDFKVPVKIRKVIKNADLLEAQVKLSQLRREVREQVHRLQPRTKREIFVDIVSLPRELMATADFSAVGRQAAILSTLDPIGTLKITKESLPAFFSQDKADEIDLLIKQHENHPIRLKAGLKIKSMENIKFSDREEYFMSSLGEKIPLYGHVVKASNRHMVSHLNLIRVMAFDRFLKTYPNAIDIELKNWANYVNIASGIGDLGAFNKVASELSIAFFSPKYSMSRIQMPYEVLKYKATPRVRKEIAKNYMKFLSTVGLALWLASMSGAEVELDPNSSDWLKIKIGATRIDLWGGLQQPTRLTVVAMLKSLDTIGVVKLEKNVDLYNSLARFIRYKLSPAVSLPLELVHKKTAIGEEVTPIQSIVRNFTPLVMEEVIDTFKANPLMGSILAPFILLGVGVQTWRKREKKSKYSLEFTKIFKTEEAHAVEALSKAGMARTKRFEGWRARKYKDTKGHWTIGYGFKINDPIMQELLPEDVLSGKRPLTKEEAKPIFEKRYAMAQEDAIKYVGEETYNKLSPLRKEILTDMAFNLGLTKLKGFENLHAALQKEDYKEAAKEMIDSDWYDQTKSRAKELVRLMR